LERPNANTSILGNWRKRGDRRSLINGGAACPICQ
jgi:hypothetical protein